MVIHFIHSFHSVANIILSIFLRCAAFIFCGWHAEAFPSKILYKPVCLLVRSIERYGRCSTRSRKMKQRKGLMVSVRQQDGLAKYCTYTLTLILVRQTFLQYLLVVKFNRFLVRKLLILCTYQFESYCAHAAWKWDALLVLYHVVDCFELVIVSKLVKQTCIPFNSPCILGGLGCRARFWSPSSIIKLRLVFESRIRKIEFNEVRGQVINPRLMLNKMTTWSPHPHGCKRR